jgi:hypothetical protein
VCSGMIEWGIKEQGQGRGGRQSRINPRGGTACVRGLVQCDGLAPKKQQWTSGKERRGANAMHHTGGGTLQR